MLKQRCLVFFVASFLVALSSASGAILKSLPGHVPSVVPHLTPVGRVAATNQLHLAIGLSLRDPAGLEQYLARLYDPGSPDYRHYLTPMESADRFGPSAQDYEAVKRFARTNGLAITGTFSNRLVLDVAGPAAAVEKAFHVTLRIYQHPTEARQFFAPDTEPTVDVELPVTDIQGLSDFSKPHPRVKQLNRARLLPEQGSSPDDSGSFFGNDFRNAYVPGTALTGAGQSVGLLEFDGYYANDIAAYAAAAGDGRTNILIQTVLLDNYHGTPGNGNVEVSLDIEMAMSIAPGLSRIISFEAGPRGLQNDVLNSILSYSSTVKQVSSSWSWSGGPSTTTDNIFKSMAAAGQSFFNAAGDGDAFTTGASSVNGVDNASSDNAPSSSPYITQVGGTTLSMNGNGASYLSETVWNWGVEYGSQYDGVGSSGGISSYYPIPYWQTNISNLTSRGGSLTSRNIPDVACNADNVYVVSGGGGVGSGGTGGTSCAAPLWAGFIALVNQQAAAPVGFINPAIYTIATNPSSYSSCFRDVTTGNNTWSESPSLFYAGSGYDLCTGLGTPNGAALINALAPLSLALLAGSSGYAFSGPIGGPFTPASGAFGLTNATAGSLSWSLINTSAWLTASATSGTLASGAGTSFTVSPSAAAGSLAVGTYAATITVSNQVSRSTVSCAITLQVYQPLSLTPNKGFAAVGPVGGPFGGASQAFVLSNLTAVSQNWTLTNGLSWLAISPAGGSLPAGGSVDLSASLAASANTLPAGVYNSSITLGGPAGLVASVPFQLSVGQANLQNGGFETGDFTGWTQSGNTEDTSVTASSGYVHSGNYGAELGPPYSLGYLTQNLATVPGQVYVLSFWLSNPSGDTPNQFQAQWNGTTVFSQSNLTGTSWTNLQFLVTATAAATTLQFGFEDNPAYFALDDVSVTTLNPVSFNSTAKLAGGFQLVLNTVTGLVYQVQYTTNLLAADWTNLGSPTTANASTMTITDTNAIQSSPQRYYRLMMVP
jgi:hypothetical protein